MLAACGCGRLGFSGSVSTQDAPVDSAPQPPVAAPRAWYRCEELRAPTVPDDSANAHDASCGPMCPTIATGRVGNACDFANGAYLRVGDDGSFSAFTQLTIAAWMQTRAPQLNQALISKPYASLNTNSWQIEVEGPARACATGFTKNCVDNVVMWGPWQHFAATYDGTMKRLYIDGIEQSAWPADVRLDTHDVVIGADYALDASGNFIAAVIPMNGLLDEVLIYDRALSGSEIAMLATP